MEPETQLHLLTFHRCAWPGRALVCTPEEIRAEGRQLKRKLDRGGGYLFTSGKPVM